jgi:quaternary ammonium compound-resistance protein SugE
MAWLYLSIGIIGEIAWVLTLKSTQGYSRLGPSIINVLLVASNIYFFAQAFKTLPTATAYAILTGTATLGVAIFGMLIYGETMTIVKILYMTLIVVGVIGLKSITA